MLSGNTIFLAVLCLAIGAVVGALLATLFSGPRAEEELPASQTKLVRRQPAGMEAGNYQEMACLWREGTEGGLLAEIGGSTYLGVQKMSPAAQQRAQELAREWLTWLGETAPPAPAKNPAASLPNLEALKITLPSRNPKKKIAIPGEETLETPDAVKKPIVVQIDDILQEMLEGSALADRGIRLTEGANMGVIVWVGNEYFQGIDHVPDPVIAQVIRTAVTEWERRSVPNR